MSFHFGDADSVVPMDEVNAIRNAFAGRSNADIGVYEGAGHNVATPRKQGLRPGGGQGVARAGAALLQVHVRDDARQSGKMLTTTLSEVIRGFF